MPEQNITTKFKVDISEFKKGITEANNQMKLANAEFKAATSGMDDWSKSISGIEAKMTQLKSVLNAQVDKLKAYKDQLKAIESAEQENGKRADELRAKLTQLSNAGVSKTSEEYKKYAKQLVEVEKEQENNKSSADKLRVTVLNQQAAVNGTVKDLRNYNTQLNELERESDDAEEEVDELNNTIEDTDKAAREAGDGFTVMKGAMAELVADGIELAVTGIKNLGAAFVNMVKDSVASYAEYEQLVGGVDTLFKESSDTVQKYAANAYKTAGVSANEYMETVTSFSASLLQSLGGDTAKAAKVANMALVDMSDNANKMGTSMASIQNAYQGFAKQNYTMLDNLKLGYGGTKTEMERLLKDAEKFSGVKYDIKNLNDVYEAIHVVQNELGITGTTAEEASTTIQGSANSMKAAWSNLLTGLADDNADMSDLISKFIDSVGTYASNLVPRIAEVLSSIVGIIKENLPAIKEQVTTWLSGLLDDTIKNLPAEFQELATSIRNGVSDAFDGFKEILSWISNNIGLVTSGLKLFVAAFATAKIISFVTAIDNTRKAIVASNAATLIHKATTQLFTNITRSATIAQNANTLATNAGTVAAKAFNTVWKANPIGVVVTLLAALAAGIYLVVKAVNKNKEAEDEEVIATKKLADEHKRLTDTIKDQKQARDEATKNAETEAGAIDVLWKRFESLVDIENKSTLEKQQMKSVVDQLNEVMPELNLKYDEEADKLNMSTEAIKNNITAQKDLIKAKAAQSQLTEIAENIAKIEIEQGEIIKQNTINEQELAKAKQATHEAYEAFAKTGFDIYSQEANAYTHAAQNEAKKQQAYTQTKTILDENNASLAKLNDEYDRTSNYADNLFSQAEIQSKLAGLNELAHSAGVDLPQSLVQGIEEGKYAVPESIEGLSALINFDNALSAAGLAGAKIPLSISEGVTNGKVSVQDAVAQVNAVVEFDSAFIKASEAGNKIPQNLHDNLINGKLTIEEANAELNGAIEFTEALAKATADGTTIPQNLAQKLTEGKVTAEEANAQLNAAIKFDEAVTKAQEGGAKIPNVLSEQITSGKMKPQDAITELTAYTNFTELLAKATKGGIDIPAELANGINSGQLKPSEAVEKINQLTGYQKMIDKAGLGGRKVPEELAKQIIDGKITVENANTQINNWIKFEKAKQTSALAGKDIPKEIANGVINGTMTVEEAIRKLNEKTVTKADELAPKMKKSATLSGNWFLEGLGLGLGDPTKNSSIQTSVVRLGNDTLDSLHKSLDENSPSKKAEQAGKYFLDGVRQGIDNRDKRNGIFNSIASFGSKLLQKLQDALSEKSPSKATAKMGEYLLDGLGIGIEDKEDGVLNQIKDFGSNVIKTFQDQLNENTGIQDMIDNVKSSVSKAKSSISNMNIPSLSGAVTNSNVSNVVNNFNQVINAPQQPSRAELYRQTRNLLNLKGGY